MQRTSPSFTSEQYFISEISGEMFYADLKRFVWRGHAAVHPVRHVNAALRNSLESQSHSITKPRTF